VPGQLFGPMLTPTPVPTPTPAYPTYSEVVSTYPAGVELSCTDAEVSDVTPDGEFVFIDSTKLLCAGLSRVTVTAGGTFTFSGDNYKTYGAKITIINTVTIDGKTYQAGAMLTVDKDLNWIQVLSWK